jgi:dihydroorotase
MSEQRIVIRGGRLVDPATNRDEVGDILIVDGVIREIGPDLSVDEAEVVDAEGMIVSPAWIDVHVHLRQPGFDEKETVATGTDAAVAGGFSAVACMPNTKPALDSPEVIGALLEDARQNGKAHVYPIASITKGRALRESVDFDAVIEAGAVGWSDDGDTTPDSAIMR